MCLLVMIKEPTKVIGTAMTNTPRGEVLGLVDCTWLIINQVTCEGHGISICILETLENVSICLKVYL